MIVRPSPVLLKTFIKNPASGLRFKHENITFTNTNHAAKVLWIAL